MSKLINRLQNQLKNTEYKKDAEDCIEIYNWIKDTDPEDKVWKSRWTPLVDVKFKGFPSDERTYKPSITGYKILDSMKIRRKISSLIEEFRELYHGDMSDDALSLLLTELQKI